jgi:type VI secretion system protein ImpG
MHEPLSDKLLPHYERELDGLRRHATHFASRFPKIAARLAMSGGRSEDPHVERLTQFFALLAARIDARIEDDYPEFTESLLEILYADYLRPFPSCSIAQFEAGDLFDRLTEPVTIARGTELVTKAGGCRFRTAYDVTLAPLQITDARYASTATAPNGITLPPDTTGIVSITFATLGPTLRMVASAAPGVVRMHMNGQVELVATLVDALLLRASTFFVEPDGQGKWKPLARTPVTAVGFNDQDALVEGPSHMSPEFRLLSEYIPCPDKFDFVDLDIVAVTRATGPCRSFTLHMAIARVPKDSWAAEKMGQLTAENFRLFCTPIVNLFKLKAEPVKTDSTAKSYPVSPKTTNRSAVEVYSIDSVSIEDGKLADKRPLYPFSSLLHGSSARLSDSYWVALRDEEIAHANPGFETALGVIDLDGRPVTSQISQLNVDLTCTNRDIPNALPFGLPGGDLLNEGGTLPCKILMLRQATKTFRFSRGEGALWRLITHLTPQPVQLSRVGFDELKRVFRQYATLSPSQTRHIDSVTFLNLRSSVQWIARKPSPGMVRGIEIRLSIDEQAFAGSSLSVFIDVMDRFFARYASENSFVQLLVISQDTGADIRRCSPRQGAAPLL